MIQMSRIRATRTSRELPSSSGPIFGSKTGFLDIFGTWDPSLGFVMGGAILIAAPLLYFFENKKHLILVSQIALPNKSDINSPLVVGALLFGIGWGMVGFCPGPAISSIALLKPLSLLFVGSMIVGFYLSQLIKNN